MLLRPYERAIFKRYMLPQRGEGFIFVAAAFSFVAVMLGVAALVVVMSVMNGVRADLFEKSVGLNGHAVVQGFRSEEHTSELQSLMRISYAVLCLKKKYSNI